MSEDRKIRNDIVAIGILALIIFLAASLATYDQRDPAHKASVLLNEIYQPDQLYYPAQEEFSNACGRIGAWTADMLSNTCLLYTSPSPRDLSTSRMPSSA